MLLHARGAEILRIKGLLDVGGEGPLLISCVQHAVYPPVHLDCWPDEDRRSRLVVIGHDVDPEALETSLRAFNRAGVSPPAGLATANSREPQAPVQLRRLTTA